MRRHETRTEENQYIAELICDLCGTVAPKSETSRGCWGSHPFSSSFEMVKIEHKDITDCQDEQTYVKRSVDMCPECFKKKLVPWLQDQGATIHRSLGSFCGYFDEGME